MPNLSYKIIAAHLARPAEMIPGEAVEIKIDNTLTQDATGTMAYLQLEKMGIDRVKCKAVSYVDHNTLQSGYMNADDHKYLQTVANRYGVLFSKPGNGICHQVQLERFDIPGETLLGSDSHTPTAGGMGVLAMGAGGLDVACAMAGIPYTITLPEIINVRLHGALPHGSSAKDIILKLLEIKSVKGGVGKIFEYSGDGVLSLQVPERSTITNMGAELGATTSIFPSDENTRIFLEKQGRGQDYRPLAADADAEYAEIIDIDLSQLKPLAAAPHSPDNIKSIAELEGTPVDQVLIGSCTNSSFTDLCTVANILRGKKVHPDVSLAIAFGSRQVLTMLAQNGALADIVASGARLLEAACGPCIGMGQSPRSKGVSLRTFNRNFYGRSGTMDADVYLVSPETAAASAIAGKIVTAESLEFSKADLPARFLIDDSMIVKPDLDPAKEIVKGPNIKDIPVGRPLAPMKKKVMIKVGDNITTDHIMPAGSAILPYRSNIEKISTFCYSQVDKEFPRRCMENEGGFIVGGDNYGQGSSREHAALAPLYLGIRAVLAKSYARIHRQNLINAGILPLLFANGQDYDNISLLDELEPVGIEQLQPGQDIKCVNHTTGTVFTLTHDLREEDIASLRHGGLLNKIKAEQGTAE